MTDATWHSLIPPLIAIGLAIATRRVLLPLLAGILGGAFLLASAADPAMTWSTQLWATGETFVAALVSAMFDPQDWTAFTDHQQVLVFSLLLGAMVGVLEHGGAMVGLLRWMSGRIRSRRAAQTLISTSGLAIFFDDYANTLLIGGAYRSMADRYGISRAKLAYLVDSTAAPVAGLALVSTWVATEISYLEQGLQDAGVAGSTNSFELFLASIPYRFYPLLAIITVFAVAITGRDLGPMCKAEQQAAAKLGKNHTDDPVPTSVKESSLAMLVIAAVLPIVACVLAVAITLYWTGSGGQISGGGSLLQTLGQIIGNGNSYWALIVGGSVGLIAAWLGGLLLGAMPASRLLHGTLAGAWQMMPAMVVLWLAWTLSAMTTPEQLNTGGYLTALLGDHLSPVWLPTIVFVLSGFVAFSTGTSWGTMAILTPLSVSMALQLDTDGGVGGSILLATFSSVLAGSIFGDHCSPISDTTVLSSRSCGCDHIEHVKTQMPYALLAGVASIVFGTVPAAFGISPWICLIAGAASLFGLLMWRGRKTVDGDFESADVIQG